MLISVFANAQNKRLTYEYSYTLNSTNKAGLQKEMVAVDVNLRGSQFYSYDKIKSDYIHDYAFEQQKN